MILKPTFSWKQGKCILFYVENIDPLHFSFYNIIDFKVKEF